MEDYYLMALSLVDGIGRRKIFELLKAFQSPEDIWNASLEELTAVKGISSDNAVGIRRARMTMPIEKLIAKLEKMNIQYISILNTNFPSLLKEINDPPVGIYVKGNLPRDDLYTVGIIGARRCSAYGAGVAYRLSKDLGKENVVVVSGLAMGIDSEAHKGVLDGGGKTMAILGCGVDVCYPSSNQALMNRIISKGCVISEYPPGVPAVPGNFPARNRIISGLSRMIIVVEAAKKSGTMITADQALDNGRDVFVVPGNITSSLSAGTNELIRQGCPIITNCEDVLFELSLTYNEPKQDVFNIIKSNSLKRALVKGTSVKTILNKETDNFSKDFKQKEPAKEISLADNTSLTKLTNEQALVYEHISGEPITADEIARKLEKPVKDVLYAISLLELYGYIKKLPQSGYIKEA